MAGRLNDPEFVQYHAFGVREGYEYRSTKYVEGRVELHLAV